MIICQNEIPLQFTLEGLQAAKTAGLTTVFNPSPMLSQSEMDQVNWEHVDWLVVNEDELYSLYVVLTGLSEKVGSEIALQELHAHSLLSNTNIVATRGAQGLSAISAAISPHGWSAETPAGTLSNPLVNTVSDCSLNLQGKLS